MGGKDPDFRPLEPFRKELAATVMQELRLADLVVRVKSSRIASTRWKAGVRG